MFEDAQMRNVIKIAILIFIILISVLIFNLLNNLNSKSNENSEPTLSLTTDSNIFSVDSILIYSSANALSNSEMQKDYWDLNLYQFSDLSININNNVSIEDTTKKNTIKKMYIDNISYPSMPDKGNPKLYYKNSNLFGIGIIDEQKLVDDKLNFNIITTNDSEVSEPSFYSDCSNPILLSSINQNIVSNFIRRNTNSAVIFDGNLLLDASILLSNIEYTISFSIHIINNLDEEYICNLTIPIKLSDNNDIETIYDGYYQVTLNDFKTNKFYKVQN